MPTTFTSYAFPVSGGPTRRTTPARLNDVVNVKDFNAKGDGIIDDTDAINASIDYAYRLGISGPGNNTGGGAVIFFPPGIYLVGKGGTTRITLDRDPATVPAQTLNGMSIIGCGSNASIIRGTWAIPGSQFEDQPNGFLLICGFWDTQLRGVWDLGIENLSTDTASGCLMVNQSQRGGFVIQNCRFKGANGFYAQFASFGGYAVNCVFESTRAITSASAAARHPVNGSDFHNTFRGALSPAQHPPSGRSQFFGTAGLWFGQGFAANCLATGFDIGFAIDQYNMSVSNKAVQCCVGLCSSAVNGDPTPGGGPDIGGGVAIASMGGRPSVGSVFLNNRFERCTWGIYIPSTWGIYVYANYISGDTGPYIPATIDNITRSGSTATVTTHDPHNLVVGTPIKLVLVTNLPGWTPGNTGNEIVTCTPTTATQFTYTLSSGPTSGGSGTWNYPIEYGITIGSSRFTNYYSNCIEAVASVASFDATHLPLPGGVGNMGMNMLVASRGPYGWSMDSGGGQANVSPGCWEYIQCGASPTKRPLPGITFNVLPPAGVWDLQPPVEGLERLVTDCQTTSAGAVVSAGGSSNRYKLRYNGTNWTRAA